MPAPNPIPRAKKADTAKKDGSSEYGSDYSEGGPDGEGTVSSDK